MSKMVYEWGRNTYKVSAQDVGDMINEIAGKNGACTPQALVTAAADEASPAHGLFTWDDDEAAGKWRHHQARNVINAITVRVVHGGSDVSAPAFISVGHVAATQDDGSGYRSLSVVMADEGFAHEALWQAVMQLRAVERRYRAIKDLAPVWEAVAQIEDKLPKRKPRAA